MNDVIAPTKHTLLALIMALMATAVGCSAGGRSDNALISDVSDERSSITVDPENTGVTDAVSSAPVIVPSDPNVLLEAAADVLGSGTVLEAHDMAIEPSGVQVRVERIEQRADATFVRLAIVNGADGQREVPHHDTATITLPDGKTLEPSAAFPGRSELLESGERDVVVLVYPAIKGPFDLDLGVDGTLTDPFSRFVGFRFEGLDPDVVTSGLQADAPLQSLDTHPNGTQIETNGIRFTADRIGVDLEVRNGAPFDLWMFGAHETSLEDDLGNRYRALVTPNGPTFFELDAESSLEGVLTFAGRMDPRATSFTIFVNDGGLTDNSQATSPAFVLGPFEVGAATALEVPDDIDLDVTLDQTGGSTATLSAIRFDDETIKAEVRIINDSDEAVDFNTGLTYLVDSEGITYRSQIEELPELVLSPGEGFEGEIVFSGRLQPAASSVRLTINHGGLIRHSFFFDAVDVTRSTGSRASFASFEVPDVSQFSIGSLETTSVAEVAGAIAEFDGREVDGGVLLTLPETILFDFGKATLRPEATSSIALVADILDFYQAERVLVVGHTDSIGDDASNIDLSEARAEAVREGLLQTGVDPDLVRTEGRGESEPVAPNQQTDGSDDPDGRQLNRRVEIFVPTTLGIPEG